MPPDTRKNGSKGPRILIVDDDPGQRSLLDSFLRSQGFETVPVASGEQALETLRAGGISMMISDVRMPGLSGLETMRRARKEHAVLPILLVTAYADIREAVGAMRDGALNYLAKPIDLDELLTTVQQATGIAQPASLKFSTDKQLPPHVVARSPLMQAVFHDASLIASSESRILITGESGVGKEVLADVIHAWSPRASGPMVKVNCAAIPETLLESELFGHVKGAFTGAVAQRIGRFEVANNGTIFLDEVADMSPPLQAKLLRVTQEGRFHRVGSNTELRTNARIRNCEYLTAKLAAIPGITPPYVRPGYKHVYHIYNCLWDERVHGVSRDRFCQALNAEGVYAVGYILDANYRFAPESQPIQANGPIHLRTIFQERNLYGKGCPFQCPHIAPENQPVYKRGDLPVSEEMANREFGIFQPDLSPPNDQRDMQLIVDAITKVVENIADLQ